VEHELDSGGFGWGYNGGGTSRAAAVILADALNLGDPVKCGMLVRLREAFCLDVLSQMCKEFRLRRGAVLRWPAASKSSRGISASRLTCRQ
jgi:hypothetical protein